MKNNLRRNMKITVKRCFAAMLAAMLFASSFSMTARADEADSMIEESVIGITDSSESLSVMTETSDSSEQFSVEVSEKITEATEVLADEKEEQAEAVAEEVPAEASEEAEESEVCEETMESEVSEEKQEPELVGAVPEAEVYNEKSGQTRTVETLAEALTNVQEGDVIKIADAMGTRFYLDHATFTISKSCKLDLNGHDLMVFEPHNMNIFSITNNATFEVFDSRYINSRHTLTLSPYSAVFAGYTLFDIYNANLKIKDVKIKFDSYSPTQSKKTADGVYVHGDNSNTTVSVSNTDFDSFYYPLRMEGQGSIIVEDSDCYFSNFTHLPRNTTMREKGIIFKGGSFDRDFRLDSSNEKYTIAAPMELIKVNASLYKFISMGDNYTVLDENGEQQYGYTRLEDALELVPENGIISVNTDVSANNDDSLNKEIIINKSITLEMNGFSMQLKSAIKDGGYIKIEQGKPVYVRNGRISFSVPDAETNAKYYLFSGTGYLGLEDMQLAFNLTDSSTNSYDRFAFGGSGSDNLLLAASGTSFEGFTAVQYSGPAAGTRYVTGYYVGFDSKESTCKYLSMRTGTAYSFSDYDAYLIGGDYSKLTSIVKHDQPSAEKNEVMVYAGKMPSTTNNQCGMSTNAKLDANRNVMMDNPVYKFLLVLKESSEDSGNAGIEVPFTDMGEAETFFRRLYTYALFDGNKIKMNAVTETGVPVLKLYPDSYFRGTFTIDLNGSKTYIGDLGDLGDSKVLAGQNIIIEDTGFHPVQAHLYGADDARNIVEQNIEVLDQGSLTLRMVNAEKLGVTANDGSEVKMINVVMKSSTPVTVKGSGTGPVVTIDGDLTKFVPVNDADTCSWFHSSREKSILINKMTTPVDFTANKGNTGYYFPDCFGLVESRDPITHSPYYRVEQTSGFINPIKDREDDGLIERLEPYIVIDNDTEQTNSQSGGGKSLNGSNTSGNGGSTGSGGAGGAGGSGGGGAGGPGKNEGLLGSAPTYSEYWHSDANGAWKVSDKAGKTVTNAWLCDNAVTTNGENIWYLMNHDGSMLAAGLVQDLSGNFYSLETEHNGFYGMLRYVDGWYNCNGQQVYLQFSHRHDGTFGAVINPDGLAKLKAIYPVTPFGIGNQQCVYTASF